MRKFFLLLTVVFSFSVASNFTHAADEKKGTKKKSLSFEDELVEGGTAKPDLFYLFQKKNFNYSKLIKLRENFIPEVKRTTEDLKPNRRGN